MIDVLVTQCGNKETYSEIHKHQVYPLIEVVYYAFVIL